jgi:hypothetical protein
MNETTVRKIVVGKLVRNKRKIEGHSKDGKNLIYKKYKW